MTYKPEIGDSVLYDCPDIKALCEAEIVDVYNGKARIRVDGWLLTVEIESLKPSK